MAINDINEVVNVQLEWMMFCFFIFDLLIALVPSRMLRKATDGKMILLHVGKSSKCWFPGNHQHHTHHIRKRTYDLWTHFIHTHAYTYTGARLFAYITHVCWHLFSAHRFAKSSISIIKFVIFITSQAMKLYRFLQISSSPQ